MMLKQKQVILLTSVSGFLLSFLLSLSVFAWKSGDCDAKTKASSSKLMQTFKDENESEKKKCSQRPEDLAIVGTKLDPCTMERLHVSVCNKPGESNRFPASEGLTPGLHYSAEPGEWTGK